MFKFFPYIVFLTVQLGGLSTAIAQPDNLVPNPSFEDTIDHGNGFFSPKYWDMTLGSPDYFNSSFKPPLEGRKTPFSYYGYQIPKNGNAYMGIVIKKFPVPQKREYVQIKLLRQLEKDSIYYVSFWVNLPDSFHWSCEQQNIGFAFSDTLVKSNFEVLDRLIPNYTSDSVWDPRNKSGWENICKTVKALSNEKYLIIGNFKNSSSTTLQNIGGGEKPVFKEQSYYFIDNIELYLNSALDTSSTPDTTENNSIIVPNIFTPNNDGKNDIWKPLMMNIDFIEARIFDRWGKFISFWKEPNGFWNGNNCEEGVYFYKIIYRKNGKEHQSYGSLTLLR